MRKHRMDFAALIPVWLDAFLIAPFRWPASPTLGFWLGSALIAVYCTLLGEFCAAVIFLIHHRYFDSMQDDMVRYHNLSVQALHAGNKEAYLAANTMAREGFGKNFFAQASIGISSLWPVPFALGWMALRFEGIYLYRIPGTERYGGYVFVLLSLYIVIRVLFSRYAKPRLPLFRHINDIKRKAREARGAMRPLLSPPPS
jgi:hypothetical protein